MQRVSVIGPSGSGKSTLARTLAQQLDATWLELDSIYHQADWTPLPVEEYQRRIAEFVQGERWVVDGNYSEIQDLVWEAADTVEWIDLPRRTIFPWLVRRTLRRVGRGEELWNGNRERWWFLIDPRPSRNILLWQLTAAGRQRLRNRMRLQDPRWAHLVVHRPTTPDEIAEFLGEPLDSRPPPAASEAAER
jgi:adenylate kinase family enzyme